MGSRRVDLKPLFSYLFKVQKFSPQRILSLIRAGVSPNRLLYLTVLSNVFLGFAFGRIIVMPPEELMESISIKVLLIIGTCLFFSYLLSTRNAAKGITCCPSGKIRPFLRELFLCAAMNAFIFLLSLSLFFFKAYFL